MSSRPFCARSTSALRRSANARKVDRPEAIRIESESEAESDTELTSIDAAAATTTTTTTTTTTRTCRNTTMAPNANGASDDSSSSASKSSCSSSKSALAAAALSEVADEDEISTDQITEHHFESRERCDLALLVEAEEEGKFDKYTVHLEYLSMHSQWFDALRDSRAADAQEADNSSSFTSSSSSSERPAKRQRTKSSLDLVCKSIQVIRMPPKSLTSPQLKAYFEYSYRLSRLEDLDRLELALAARYLSDSRLLQLLDDDCVRRFSSEPNSNSTSRWSCFIGLAHCDEFQFKTATPLYREAFFSNLTQEVAKVECEDKREDYWAMISKEMLVWGIKHLIQHKLVETNLQANKTLRNLVLTPSAANADSEVNSKSSGDAAASPTCAASAAQAAKAKAEAEAAAQAALSFVCDDEAIQADKITQHHYEPREKCDLALLIDAKDGKFDKYFVHLDFLATFSQWFDALKQARKADAKAAISTTDLQLDVASLKARLQQILRVDSQDSSQVVRMPPDSLTSRQFKAYLEFSYRLKRCEDFNQFQLGYAARYLGDSRLLQLVDEDLVHRFASEPNWRHFACVACCDEFHLKKSTLKFREAFFNNLAREIVKIKQEMQREDCWRWITKETLVWGIKHLIANKLVLPKPKAKEQA